MTIVADFARSRTEPYIRPSPVELEYVGLEEERSRVGEREEVAKEEELEVG